MKKIYLHTGSNMGNKTANLEKANELISEEVGIILRKSGFYKTEAWGKTDQEFFINQALEVETNLDPFEVLDTILNIENKLGRIRVEKWGSRLIDIDLIFYHNWIINFKKLTVPHPFMQERNFVLAPLNEIIPEFVHPVFEKKIEVIFSECTDNLDAVVLE